MTQHEIMRIARDAIPNVKRSTGQPKKRWTYSIFSVIYIKENRWRILY
jgi:hypothetical protein